MLVEALKLLAYKEKGIDLLPGRFCLLSRISKLQLNSNLRNKKYEMLVLAEFTKFRSGTYN